MIEYGYIRVSDREQNENRQIDAMMELQIPKDQIFVDKHSGKDFKRPAWQMLIEKLKKGDLLYVKSIDRLGRNYDDIQNQWRYLTKEKRVNISIIDMPILDTRYGRNSMETFIADIVLAILCFVAQNECETIKRRQAEGIAAAKARGVRFGRPIKKSNAYFIEAVNLLERGEISLEEALNRTELKQATFYRRRRENKDERLK